MSAAVDVGFQGAIVYPETDGAPMGETDLHIDETIDAREALKQRFQGDANAYVSGNNLIYYEEGNPAARFSPDVYVVFGVPKRKRRIYKLWEEKHAPAFVLEVTSRGTRLEDKGSKKELCAELGVQDYFLFDPEGDYLKPPLQGFRLASGSYAPIAPDAEGRIFSRALGLSVAVEQGRLRFIDPATGARLLRVEEQAARAEQAEARAQAAEAEVARLRALLEKK